MPRTARAEGRRDGFTLLEVIVALTITGLVVSAVALALSVAVDAADRARAAQHAARHERNARAVVTSLLRAAHLDLRNAPKGFQAGSDELRFASRVSYPLLGFRDREPVAVHLWVTSESGAATSERGVWLSLASLHPSARRADSLVLFPHVTGMQLSYRDGSGTWRDEWPHPARLPDMIRVVFAGTPAPPPIEVTFPLAGTR